MHSGVPTGGTSDAAAAAAVVDVAAGAAVDAVVDAVLSGKACVGNLPMTRAR